MALIERQDTVERLPVGSLAGRALEAEQLARYRWAAQAVSGKDVLDAGCGAGLGTRILAQAGASRVTGLDASEETVAEAVRGVGDVAELVAGDLKTLPFAPAAFDVAVCFGVVERVEQREQLLDELERVLREDGILLISLPGGVEGELTSRFPAVSLHHQHSRLASAIAADGGLPQADSARLVAPPDAGHVPATLAVAGKRETPDLRDLVVLAEALEVQRWEDEVTQARRQTDEALRQVEAARGREEHATSERQLVARRLIEAEQLTAQAQMRAHSLEEEMGRRREEIVSRDVAVAAVQQVSSRGMASLRRGAKALLGARR